MCAADIDEQGLKAYYCTPGDIFAGRRVCFHSRFSPVYTYYDEPAQQELGACCRRLLGSRGVDVQISVCE